MILVKIHSSHGKEIVAICDKNLIGKEFFEDEKQLLIKESFYSGDKMNEKELEEIMKKSSSLNLVGEESIKLALKLKLIDKESIGKIKGIPYGFVYALE